MASLTMLAVSCMSGISSASPSLSSSSALLDIIVLPLLLLGEKKPGTENAASPEKESK